MLNPIERRRTYVANGVSTNSGVSDTGAKGRAFSVADLAGFGVQIVWAGSNLAGAGFFLEGAMDSAMPVNSWMFIASQGVLNTSQGLWAMIYSGGPNPQPYETVRIRETNPVSNYAGTWSAFVFGAAYDVGRR